MKKSAMSDLEHHLEDTKGSWPLAARVIAVEDVISALPRRLETKGYRLNHTIRKFLLTELDGEELGQCKTPTGARPRLYAINGSAAILSGQLRTVAGRIYEEDMDRARKNQPLAELDIADEFGTTE
jgi:hypothetical protein